MYSHPYPSHSLTLSLHSPLTPSPFTHPHPSLTPSPLAHTLSPLTHPFITHSPPTHTLLHLSLCPSALSISPSVPPLSLTHNPSAMYTANCTYVRAYAKVTPSLKYVLTPLPLTLTHPLITLTPNPLTLHSPSPLTHALTPRSHPFTSHSPFHHTLTPHSHSPPRQMTPATDGTPPVKTPWTGPASQPGQLAEQAPAGTCHQEEARG